MKKTLLFVFSLALPCFLSAQVIPNNGFEDWTTGDPVSWKSPNSITSGLGVYTMSKEVTDVYAGTNSVKLQSKTVIAYPVPGILTNGNLAFSMSATPPVTVNGGMAFTERPERFKGYYKYTPATGDNCFLVAMLVKQNSVTLQNDTVGYAEFTQNTTVGTWTQFDVTFTYNSAETPDTLQIVLVSSNPSAPVVGSILLIDELSLEGGTLGTGAFFPDHNLNVYPNPANDILNVSFSKGIPVNSSATFFNMVGQKVLTVNIPAGSQLSRINVASLKNGLYFMELTSGKERIVSKVTIN